MTASSAVLDVRELSIGFPSERGLVQAADEVSFDVYRGETLGLVGESGCGKSVTLRTLIGLLPEPGEVMRGRVTFEGRELTRLSTSQLDHVRGTEIAMVFQDPASSLNPVLSIGAQLCEVLRVKRGLGRRRRAARARACSRALGSRGRPASPRLPAPAERRHAPARDDRDRDRVRSEAAPRR